MTSLGPQLIGQTEKALDALLLQILRRHDLTPSQWVVLQIAARHEGDAGLDAAVRESAHFDDADVLIAGLTDRGLLAGDALTPSGRALRGEIGEAISRRTDAIWASLDPEEAAITARVLDGVLGLVRAEIARGR